MSCWIVHSGIRRIETVGTRIFAELVLCGGSFCAQDEH
jgi:hypothetical protein